MLIFLDMVFDHRVGRGRAAEAEVAGGAAADDHLRHGRHHAALPLASSPSSTPATAPPHTVRHHRSAFLIL